MQVVDFAIRHLWVAALGVRRRQGEVILQEVEQDLLRRRDVVLQSVALQRRRL